MKRILIYISILLFIVSPCFGQNTDTEFQQIIRRAESGDSYYQAILGEIYLTGEGVAVNPQKALKWLNLAAEKNEPNSQFALASMYMSGIGVARDNEKAILLCQTAFPEMVELAKRGDFRAQTNLGLMYLYGLGIPQDAKKAFQLNKQAMAQMYPRAWFYMSRYIGQELGSESDYKELKSILEKKAEHGDKDAQYWLGNLYANGLGVEKDFYMAVKLFKQSQHPMEFFDNPVRKEDFIIQNLDPPQYVLAIPEQSCIENCIWSILHSRGDDITQLEINKAGGYPNRGLQGEEIIPALDYYGVKYRELFRSVASSESLIVERGYHDFLYKQVIATIKNGNPVIIGVKNDPDSNINWTWDHALLVVGYNEITDELIYNDFNKRKRMPAGQLITKDGPYTFINHRNLVYTMEFLGFSEKGK